MFTKSFLTKINILMITGGAIVVFAIFALFSNEINQIFSQITINIPQESFEEKEEQKVGLRLLPHPPNFAPIAAIALFAGVYLSRKLAFFLPTLAMVISDIFIGYYDFRLMAAVYGSFLLCVLLGFWLKKNKKWYTIGGSAIFGAILFFLITNFTVWVFTPWYTKTIAGLIQCFLMALPFFKNTLMGNLFYVSCFFGFYELAKYWIKKKYGCIVYQSSLV